MDQSGNASVLQVTAKGLRKTLVPAEESYQKLKDTGERARTFPAPALSLINCVHPWLIETPFTLAFR
jgi:hypothetical protein